MPTGPEELLRHFTPTFIFYHHPCQDGSMAAAIAGLKYPGAQLRKLNYEQPLPYAELRRQSVLFLDTALTAERVAALDDADVYWRLLDHHATSERLQSRDNCCIDLTRCASLLTWAACMPLRTTPQLLFYIDAYDRWTKAIPEADVVVAALNSYGHEALDSWKDWLQKPDADLVLLLQEGRAILRAAAVRRDWLRAEGRVQCFSGVEDVLCFNAHPDFDAMNRLGEGEALRHPFVVFWWQLKTGEYRYSFRANVANPDYVPVSLVAACYPRGGGHAEAAGMTSPYGPASRQITDGVLRGSMLWSAAQLWAPIKALAPTARDAALKEALRYATLAPVY